jgi:hypothetical protein
MNDEEKEKEKEFARGVVRRLGWKGVLRGFREGQGGGKGEVRKRERREKGEIRKGEEREIWEHQHDFQNNTARWKA